MMKTTKPCIEPRGESPGISRFSGSNGVETLHIRDCPWCQQHHTYLVRVSRVPISETTPTGDILRFNRRNQLIRYFNCPVTNNRFKGILTLFHSPREVIRDIEVLFVTKSKKAAS